MIPQDLLIAVLMGGPGSEREVSLASGNAVLKALKAAGCNAVGVDVAGPDFALPEGTGLAYNVIHGTFGEDGELQAILEGRGIPYTGAGVASIQIASMLGAHTIGTSGSTEKLERLKSVGLEVGIATRSGDFAARAKEASGGGGVALVVNCVGGSVFPECMRALAYQGRIATVGYVDGVLKSEIDLGALHANRYLVFGVSNSKLTAEGRARAVRGFTRDVLPAIADGRITPLIDRIYGFDELQQAKARMESNAQVGKIVVRMA